MPLEVLLIAQEYFNVGIKLLGRPDYFAYALIVLKILRATALMIPSLLAKLREWAYAGLTFNLIFAVIGHLAADKNIGFILMPVIIGFMLAVAYFYSQKFGTIAKKICLTIHEYHRAISGAMPTGMHAIRGLVHKGSSKAEEIVGYQIPAFNSEEDII